MFSNFLSSNSPPQAAAGMKQCFQSINKFYSYEMMNFTNRKRVLPLFYNTISYLYPVKIKVIQSNIFTYAQINRKAEEYPSSLQFDTKLKGNE